EAEQARGDRVLVVEVGAEHGRVVGVDGDQDAGPGEVLQRVLVEVRHRAGGDVGGGADLQRDAPLGQVAQQLRVLGGAGAVPDAFGAQVVLGVPHRLGAGGLAGVRLRAQAGGAGAVEVRLELRAGHA